MDVNFDYSGNTIGQYHMLQKLGKGNFGAVYRAFDIVLQSEKAIKIMNVADPQKAYELFKEAAIPYKCKHNNVVVINGGSIETYEQQLHFVIDMELVNGGSLEQAICANQISTLDAVSIIKNVLFGLQHSHVQGIVHRDIKPANILLSNGIPKLSDFGLSATLNSMLDNEPWYVTHAAPEIFCGGNIATVETDIYAMGMTLFRAANGISDWNKYLCRLKNPQTLLSTGKFIAKAPYHPKVHPKIIRILKKACDPHPANRYHSAAEMRDALEKLQLGINWYQREIYLWEGFWGMQNHTAELVQHPRSFEVIVKVNQRKNSSTSKKFDNEDDAKSYLLKYISNTTLLS